MKIKIIFCLIISMICMLGMTYGAEYKEGIDNFPDSYKPYLYALQDKHPNWKFTAMYTGLDWNTVLNKESYLSGRYTVSLAPKYWDRSWHCILSNGSIKEVEQRLGYSIC